MVTATEVKSTSRRSALDRASRGALFAGSFVGMGVLSVRDVRLPDRPLAPQRT